LRDTVDPIPTSALPVQAIIWRFSSTFTLMSLRIIATGGTFDKHYDPLTGDLVFSDSVLPEALARARLTLPVNFEALLALDSLDMQDHHREQILAACKRCDEDNIVVVHGTDTMPETARYLGRAKLNKIIVLTGAMVPYQITQSDAFFNLGFACAAATLATPGVYIGMNGRLFPWDDVMKNRAAGIFQPER
jgi:L-asparaginase